jgi:hypothetical protein
MKSDVLKRDLPRRDGVEMKKSSLAAENDAKWFWIGLSVTLVGGLAKALVLEKYGR